MYICVFYIQFLAHLIIKGCDLRHSNYAVYLYFFSPKSIIIFELKFIYLIVHRIALLNELYTFAAYSKIIGIMDELFFSMRD